jgi:dienelactone hydrolase
MLLKRILIWIVLPILLSVVAVAVWMMIPYPVQDAAIEEALRSDSSVKVLHEEYLVFAPASFNHQQGLIFYPGGKTSVSTFAPLLRQLAEAGILVIAVPMPFNTAFLGMDRATQVMADFPAVSQWYLAGHSLGGVVAAMYARDNAPRLQGLVLWASYPAVDLSSLPLDVLSIYAQEDLSTTVQDISEHKAWLPEHTVYTPIKGNHWQFGHFSDKKNQQLQTSTRDQQQKEILSATLKFMR